MRRPQSGLGLSLKRYDEGLCLMWKSLELDGLDHQCKSARETAIATSQPPWLCLILHGNGFSFSKNVWPYHNQSLLVYFGVWQHASDFSLIIIIAINIVILIISQLQILAAAPYARK
jgi:hypothetical protein